MPPKKPRHPVEVPENGGHAFTSSSWLLLVSPGFFLLFLVAPGSSWKPAPHFVKVLRGLKPVWFFWSLAPPGFSLLLRALPGYSWLLLKTSTKPQFVKALGGLTSVCCSLGPWFLLASPGFSWFLLASPCSSCFFLGVPGPSWRPEPDHSLLRSCGA